MAKILCKTNGNTSPRGKRRVYFTCHPDDFGKYFHKLCEDIFKTHDCAIFYTQDMREPIPEQNWETDLESNSLFIVPVTLRLLSKPNRAMDFDIPFAIEKHIPVLPFMMESGIDAVYSRKFGELQYLNPNSTDATEVSYQEKLKKYLESVLISDKMVKQIRAAFDAYIFLSYRKKDRHHANTLMKLIHSLPQCRDIAIWYDEFLTPGENFRDNIEKALEKSKLFTLLVTPSLLEEPDGAPNFVMAEEYPAAQKSGIDILPAEMEQTDKTTLEQKYEGIPSCVDPHDESFKTRLLSSLAKFATTASDDDPMHNFLIGLAYLDGIDVEVNRQHALELITMAAEANLPAAMEKLRDMFRDGVGVHLDYQEAAKWGQRLCEHYIQTSGQANKTTLDAQFSLALIYVRAKNFNQALELLDTIYPLFCNVLGTENPQTLCVLNSIAACECDGNCNYSRAKEIFTKLYRQQCELGRKETPNALTMMCNLAFANEKIGNYKAALALLNEIYALRCRILGENHRDTMDAMGRIASLYSYKGKHRKALKINTQLYESAYKLFGPEDDFTITQLGRMACCYFNMRQYEKAKVLFENQYTLLCQQFGENHPDTIGAFYDIADCNARLQNHREALVQLEKAYDQFCQTLGSKHTSAIATLGRAGSIYAALGNQEKALELYKKQYKLFEETLGLAHSKTQLAMMGYAVYYGNLYQDEKATSQIEHSFILIRVTHGMNHQNTRNAFRCLGSYYRQLINFKKQVGLQPKDIKKLTKELRHRLSCMMVCFWDRLLQENQQEILLLLNRLAVSFVNQGEYEKALHLLQDIYPLRCEALRSLPSEGLSALNRPVFFGFGIDGMIRQAKLREAAYELMLSSLGPSHPDTAAAFEQMAKLYRELLYQSTISRAWQRLYEVARKYHEEDHPLVQERLKQVIEAREKEKKPAEAYRYRHFCCYCGAPRPFLEYDPDEKCKQCGK